MTATTTRIATAAARITTAASELHRYGPAYHAVAAEAEALVARILAIDPEPEAQSSTPVPPPAPVTVAKPEPVAEDAEALSPLQQEVLTALAASDEVARAKAIKHALDANPAWRKQAPALFGESVDYTDAKLADKALRQVASRLGVKAPKADAPKTAAKQPTVAPPSAPKPTTPAPKAKTLPAPKADAKPAAKTSGLAAHLALKRRAAELKLSGKGSSAELKARIKLAEQELATKRECPATTTQIAAVPLSVAPEKADLLRKLAALDVATLTQLVELAATK